MYQVATFTFFTSGGYNMVFQHVLDCKSYFGYGNVFNYICSDSFSWDEGETVNFDNILIHFNNYLVKYAYCYFFTTKMVGYPLNFRGQKDGMWRNLDLNEHLQMESYKEERINLSSYVLFYGVCKISSTELANAIHLMKKGNRSSILLFTNSVATMEDYRNSLQITNKNFKLDIAKVINSYCSKGDAIITFIQGSNGMTINLFYDKSII